MSYLYTVRRNALHVFLLPTVRLDGFQGDEMTGCVGEVLDPPGTWDCKAYMYVE